MRLLALVLVFLLLGCARSPQQQLPLPPPLEAPPVLKDKDYYGHADDVVWYMYRVYDYTESVSRYTRTHGWVPPDVPKVCKFTPYPTLDTLPLLSLDGIDQADIVTELAKHLRKLRIFYNAQTVRLKEAESQALVNCIY